MNSLSGLPREKGEEPDRKFIEALARGLDVLRAFKPGDGFLGNQELAQRTGLPKSSISRFTYTLTKLGYLSYSERLEKYQLGSGVLALGYAYVSNLAVRQIARPLMEELAENTGTAVGLAGRDRLEMIYIEYSAPSKVKTFRHEIGDRISMATSAAGRAYLVALPEDERDYFLRYIEKKSGGDWPAIRAGLERELQMYADKGYCTSFGEWDKDVNGVSVPLVLGEGHIYTFNCGGPRYRLSEDYLCGEVAPQLKNMVRNIEAMIIRY
ncbi:IclR family transcriptional regulator [Gilvimarinus sp. F26214L]|uniref:IclR family transcriptional regulator n=1 Tax=Gilvimarinus sp. DZF01 TaxID=3461371 RepID=UPI0040461CB7